VGDKPYDTKSGYVVWDPKSRTGNYFDNQLIWVQDPQCATVTTSQGLRNSCFIRAMAKPLPQTAPGSVFLRNDAANKPIYGQILFQNPLPGTRGNFDRNQFVAPMTWNTDMALTKVIRISEGKSFQLRIDATNVFNHPFPSNGSFGSAGSRVVAQGTGSGDYPLMDLSWINGLNNRNAGYLDNKVGSRTFQAKVRIDF
jgi:hypothetical protein